MTDTNDKDFEDAFFGDDIDVYKVERNPNYPQPPSRKYGMKLTAPVMVGCIVLSFFIALFLVWVTKKRQQRDSQKRKDELEVAKEKARATLVSKSRTMSYQESMGATSTLDSLENGEVDSTSCTSSDNGVNCALCSCPLSDGMGHIFESNNPSCGHCFHAGCMGKWLELQNSCPTCNHPFLMMQVPTS